MEVIRSTMGCIYTKTQTRQTIRWLYVGASFLLILVAVVCILGWQQPRGTINYYLDESKNFYYSLREGQVVLELFVNDAVEDYKIPEAVLHQGVSYPVVAVGANAFTNRQHLRKIIIADNVQRLEGDITQKKGAFSGCVALREITWGKGISNLGPYVFKNCLALMELNLPASVQFVAEGAFVNCIGLQKISLSGNPVLTPGSLQNCVQVKRLQLGSAVGWLSSQALADLTNLREFLVAAGSTTFRVDGGCLLSADQQTLVLGGCDAELPTTVNTIAAWSFGERGPEGIIYLPGTVRSIGEKALVQGEIYTDAAVKSTDWRIDLPVHYGVTLEMLNAALAVDKTDLTTEIKSTAAFVSGHAEDYPADSLATLKTQYAHAQTIAEEFLVTQATVDEAVEKLVAAKVNLVPVLPDKTDLAAVLAAANVILDNPELRLQFKLAVWEDFKAAYTVAEAARNNPNVTVSALRQAIFDLLTCQARLYDVTDNSVWESQDWRIGIANLLTAVAALDNKDFVADGRWAELQTAVTVANNLYADQRVTAEQGHDVWLGLRKSYEELTTDLQPLQELIAECDLLVSTDYTTSSWQNFAAVLAMAQKITAKNMTVSVARQQLLTARSSLVVQSVLVNELTDLLAQTKKMRVTDYESGWDNLQNVVAQASGTLANMEVGPQVRALRQALAQLKLKPTAIRELQVWNNVVSDLNSQDYTMVSYAVAANNLAAAQKVAPDSPCSVVASALTGVQDACANLVREKRVPVTGKSSGWPWTRIMLFILAAILFTSAVVILAVAFMLRKSLRIEKPE